MKPRYMTQEGMDAGIARMLTAPRDLALAGAPVVALTLPRNRASEAHRALFARYRKELKKVLDEAIEWWEDRTATFKEEEGLSAKQARQANWREFPAGPASDPYTVAVIRKYWLACDALNRRGEAAVAPEVFLLQWIVDESDWATAEILSAMPYWPVGLDAQGHWV